MRTTQKIRWLRDVVSRKLGADAMNEQVRRTLVSSLYTQPSSLAIGAFNGILVSLAAAWFVQDAVFTAVAVAMTVAALVRVALAFAINPDNARHSTDKLELTYEIGAFAYAGLFGLLAGMAIVMGAGAGVEVLLVGHAMCYGTGISARNAGRPVIALGQMVLCFAPIGIGGAIAATPAYLVMAATIPFAMLAMVAITSNTFLTIYQSIAHAQASRTMATKMERLARTDVVTGLANRAGLNHALVQAIMNVPRERQIALFWLDLDRFKEVNDLLGHQTGDRVLAKTADRLQSVVPAGSTVSRFGGDEFVIVSEVDDRSACEALAVRILDELHRPMEFDRERLEVGCSIGIALMPEDGEDADTLLQHADLALYDAKMGGRGRSRFFDPSMTRDLANRREIEAELRAAIQRDELSIFFQPIVDLQTGKIRTFEALVRWFHPVKGELRPDQFIPVAEETGVIVTLGNWITKQAAKACAGWPEDVTVAVNLSPLQIKAPGAALGIMAALREAGLAPHRLELEITESVLVDDNSATERFIGDLSAKGVRFAMDDFGTGYSSLGYINKYPFSKIKVDRSFVSGPDIGRKTQAIIHAVAELGSQLDMEIVAEGLEKAEQVESVRAAGCTLGQGYYFSRAVPDYLAAMLLAQERGEHGSAIGRGLQATG